MDENIENEETTQSSQPRRRPSALSELASGFRAGISGQNPADIDAINNRGRNTPSDIGGKRNKKEEEGETQKEKGSDLPEKDGLDKKDNKGEKASTKDEKGGAKGKGNNAAAKAEAAKKAKAEATKKAAKKATGKAGMALKLKIYFWIAVVAIGLLSLIFLVAFFAFTFDNLTSSITSFFGISEKGLEDDDIGASIDKQLEDGLYTDDKYKYVKPSCDIDNYDEDTCKCDNTQEECVELGAEELVKVLYSDNKCKVDDTFYKILDKISEIFNFRGLFTDECQLVRYVRGKITKYNEKFNTELDLGIVIGTIFYGYDQQANYSNYKEGAEDADFISGSEHFQVLSNIIEDGKLTKKDVDRIIQNTIFEEVYAYWDWEIHEDEETGRRWGTCTSDVHKSFTYSSDKWKMFIRWNDENDDSSRNEFSVPGYMGYGNSKVLDLGSINSIGDKPTKIWGSGYVFDTNLNSSYTTTDDECNGTYTETELMKMYNLDAIYGLTDALDYFESRGFEGIIDTSHYFQKVEETNSTNKDVFTPHESKYMRKGSSSYSTYNIKYDYNEGFGYVDFPGFKEAIDDPKTDLEYDEKITPKEIETIIEEVMDRKSQLNEVLLARDMDNPLYGENGYYDQDGNYIEGIIPNTNGSVITNANCKPYLSTDLSKVIVTVKDCDGNKLRQVVFKDYIIGVTKAEIDNYENSNYAISAMIAEINYSLNRHNNYSKLPNITMRSGNCDQAFSSPKDGCHPKSSGIVCGTKDNGEKFNCTSYIPGASSSGEYFKEPMSSTEYNAFSALYDEASKYLVIENGKIKQTSYVDKKQKKWESMANSGSNFVEIIKTSYPEADLIKCYDENDTTNNTNQGGDTMQMERE